MIAYIDSSVLLRVVLGQPGRLAEWKTITRGVGSGLVEVECLRTLDRLRLRGGLSDRELAARRAAVYRLTEEMELVEPTRPILQRASHPFPVALGTLDAVHLATALLWQEIRAAAITLATHDQTLGRAALALGMPVVGV